MNRPATYGGATLLAWLVLASITCLHAGPQIEALGIYYDEAFLAQQGRDFTHPERAAVHPPSVTTGEFFGRPFPIRNAAYLGGLKSQLSIPAFALFGDSKTTLRYGILTVGLLGLLFAMLAIRRLFDDRVAIAMGVLVASDPGFHFFGQFEWGPFTSLLLCRGLGVWLLLVAIGRRSALAFAASGVVLGLGVYSRVAFVVILAAYGIATLFALRPWLLEVLREQSRGVALAAAGFTLAVVPVILVVTDVVGAGGGMSDRGDLGYRAQVLISSLDGSHWARLLAVGGRFEAMFEANSIATVFPGVLVVCVSMLGVIALYGDARDRTRALWLLVAVPTLGFAMLAISGAVRAHHMLNLLPLPQLIVAFTLIRATRFEGHAGARRLAMRGAASVAFLAVVASNLAVIAATSKTILETGGTGRFSRAVEDFAVSLDAEASQDVELVSLDWGFHLPAHFATRTLRAREPIWKISQAIARGTRWEAGGGTQSIYLYREGEDDVFGLGDSFARLVRVHSDLATIHEHRDRTGGLVFKSVRFDRPHTLVFDRRGRAAGFRLRWRDAAPPPPAPVARP